LHRGLRGGQQGHALSQMRADQVGLRWYDTHLELKHSCQPGDWAATHRSTSASSVQVCAWDKATQLQHC